MSDTKISAMTAATVATASTVPVVQGGVNKKVTMTGAGAAMIEAANAAAQQVLLGIIGGGAIGLGGFTLTVPATGTAALLGVAQTFTAANIFSANGAASTPALSLTGSVFTGGSGTTTKPLFLIETAGASAVTSWNTNGTFFGANAASGSTADFVRFAVNGTGAFKIGYNGKVTFNESFGNYIEASGFGFIAFGSNNVETFGIWGGSGAVLVSTAQLIWTDGGLSGNRDTGMKRASAGAIQVTDGSSGYGSIDASAYKVSGAAGVDFGPGLPTSITIVKGIITAAS